jgi:hypothetical protein
LKRGNDLKKQMTRACTCGLILCVVLLSAASTVAEQPALQAAQARISSPGDSAVVRDVVPVVGTATDPNFWKYELSYAPEGTEQWVLIGPVHENQVTEGLLETWATTSVPDGSYALRLRVVNRTGNYLEVFSRNILVVNAVPTDTPEPSPTPAPTSTGTPAPTPTFIIPTSPLSQPTATPTLARPTRSALPEELDVNAWRQSLCLGAELMAIILVTIAVIFVLRRLL